MATIQMTVVPTLFLIYYVLASFPVHCMRKQSIPGHSFKGDVWLGYKANYVRDLGNVFTSAS